MKAPAPPPSAFKKAPEKPMDVPLDLRLKDRSFQNEEWGEFVGSLVVQAPAPEYMTNCPDPASSPQCCECLCLLPKNSTG
jgi:hypothetical protein